MKPRIFIGSSTESLNIAYAIQELIPDMEATVWTQGIFQLSSSTLDDLITTLDRTDFGIFVFSPDDLTMIREQQFSSTRDNVVFELGLFIGRLGKNRSFFVIPKGHEDFHLPSDLLGIKPAIFDPQRQDKNLRAALGPACNQIRSAVELAKFGLIHSGELTPRLVYLLRHLGERSRWVGTFAEVLAVFDEYGDGIKVPYEQLSPEERKGWGKASEYACSYLDKLGLAYVRHETSISVRISEDGRYLLDSEEFQKWFDQGFRPALTNIDR